MNHLRSTAFLLFIVLSELSLYAQKQGAGMVTGNIVEQETGKPVPDATVSLICLTDASKGQSLASTAEGSFTFNSVSYGVYRLQISAVGFNTLSLDSIHVRPERPEFGLNDLKLTHSSAS